MSMETTNGVLVCAGTLSVEDAEALQQLLLATPDAPLDLSACSHLHSACLQVLMSANAPVAAWPQEAALALWLQSALKQSI
jgi:anti-anti-sigma regulatory factor